MSVLHNIEKRFSLRCGASTEFVYSRAFHLLRLFLFVSSSLVVSPFCSLLRRLATGWNRGRTRGQDGRVGAVAAGARATGAHAARRLVLNDGVEVGVFHGFHCGQTFLVVVPRNES